MQYFKGKWYIVIGILPFISALFGLFLEGVNLFDAAFYSVQMYVLNYSETPTNLFVEFARWTAPVVTISGIAAILGNIVKHISHRISFRFGKISNAIKKLLKIGKPSIYIAIFGEDNYELELLINNLLDNYYPFKVKIIEMHNHIPRADLYILFSDDDSNLAFYSKHKRKLNKYCSLNAKHKSFRTLSKSIVLSEFNRHWFRDGNKSYDYISDNKYILFKTEKYSVKDEFSQEITLVNLEELGAFNYWLIRWQGIYYDICRNKTLIMSLVKDMIKSLYKNHLLSYPIQTSAIEEVLDYQALNSNFLNSIVDINKYFIYELCSILNEDEIENLKKSLYFDKFGRYGDKFRDILDYIQNKTKNEKLKCKIEPYLNYPKSITEDFVNGLFSKIEENKIFNKEIYDKLRISIIGDNDMSRYLLFSALQLNIFSENQNITYNLFGEWKDYLSIHKHIGDNPYPDKLSIFSNDYLNHMEVINESDLIIVCDDDNADKIVEDLLLVTNNKKIDLISKRKDLYLKYKSNKLINFYNYVSSICNYERLIEDNINTENAVNGYIYECTHSDSPQSWIKFKNKWSLSDNSLRYSNFCQNKYRIMLKNQSDYRRKEFKTNSHFATRLEHVRWCKYQHFYNWTTLSNEYSGSKDIEHRKHKQLVEFDYLPNDVKNWINIFISYRHVDEDYADEIYLSIKDHRSNNYCLSPFYDSLINKTEEKDFGHYIFKAVENCDIFLCLMTKNSLNRCCEKGDFVAEEMNFALANQKNIITIILEDDFEWPDNLPPFLNKFKNGQSIKFSNNNNFINELADMIYKSWV